MIDDASRFAMLLKQRFPKLNVVLNCQGSEKFDLCSEMFDLVFTSPPYFNVEKYVDQPGQCWRDHPTLESWLNKYLTPTLRNAYVGLKPGKYCVINIASSLVDVVIERALSVGFERCSELDTSISLKPDHFSRKKGVTSQRMEPFVVFVKNA